MSKAIVSEPEPGKCIFCLKPLPDVEVCDCPGYKKWIEDETRCRYCERSRYDCGFPSDCRLTN